MSAQKFDFLENGFWPKTNSLYWNIKNAWIVQKVPLVKWVDKKLSFFDFIIVHLPKFLNIEPQKGIFCFKNASIPQIKIVHVPKILNHNYPLTILETRYFMLQVRFQMKLHSSLPQHGISQWTSQFPTFSPQLNYFSICH